MSQSKIFKHYHVTKFHFTFSGFCLLRDRAYCSSSYDSLLGWSSVLVGTISKHYYIPSGLWQLVIAQCSISLLHGCNHTAWIPTKCKYLVNSTYVISVLHPL